MAISNINSDCTEHINGSKAVALLVLNWQAGKISGGYHTQLLEKLALQVQWRWPMNGLSRSTIRHTSQFSFFGSSKNSLSAKTPVAARLRVRRTKAMVNWLSLPTTGRNGLPAAACQTWCNEESMCCAWRNERLRLQAAFHEWLQRGTGCNRASLEYCCQLIALWLRDWWSLREHWKLLVQCTSLFMFDIWPNAKGA